MQDIIQYAYDDSVWGDLLTEYDGRLIESDAIGNMLSDGIWTYTWEHGRQLVSMYGENIGGNNDITIDFTYDANGMRTGKTVTKNTYHTHDYAETVTAPTCTMGGYTTYTCACGTSYIGAETAALGHNYNETVIAPSCTANGYTTYTCSVCDHTETGEETPALGHDLTGVGVEDGVQYTCSRCDYSALEDHTHSYSVSTEVATCEAAGHTTYSCTDCGYSYTQTMPAIGHNYTETVTYASCTEDGSRLFVCANCQASYSQAIPAMGHSVNTVLSEMVATCFADGYREYICDNCAEVIYETTPALGHTYETYTLVGVTCTEDGYIEYMCDRCGGIFSDPYPATGHTWTEGGLVPWCVVCNYNRPGDPIFWSLRNGKLLESTETTTYSYVYNGSSLSQMTVVTEITADGETTTETHTLYFAYDTSGTPMSVTYNGTNYYYATNLQGDVTAILNTSGTAVVQYTYDAWGKLLSTTGSMASTLGTHNPLRYRGYVYDTEFKLYYLQSRYYNPGLGRFNAPDAFASTGQGILGNNMFAYCNNNPVNYSDSTGTIGRIATKGEYAQLDEIGIGGAFPIPIDPGFIDWLEEQLSKITDKMTLSLSKATSRSYKTDYEEHHIAAKKAKNAVAAAKILNEVLPGGVESTQNKVMVYTDVHRRIHTNLYYTLANSVIIYAYESANGDKLQQIKNVNGALLYLRTFIETLNSLSNIN